jgi:chromate reductase
MKLLAFAASHRPSSFNRKLAHYAGAYATAQNITVDFAEYGEFDMPVYDDHACDLHGVPDIAKSFAGRAASADGIIISSPEYNWSYPGSLKNILDWTSRLKPSPLAGKTALLLSATPGARGGIVGLQHLKTPLESLQMFVFHKVYPLGYAHDAFDATDALADGKQKQLFTAMLEEYITFTRKLSSTL